MSSMMRFQADTLRAIGDYRTWLGETSVWCDASASLLWVEMGRFSRLKQP